MIDLTMEGLWLIRWQIGAKENIFQLREEPTSHPCIMSNFTLKSIYLPFKILFPNFSVFMMDIGTFPIAFKAFDFSPSTIIHWSFTVLQGLNSHLRYTAADTRAGLFKSVGFVLPKSRCKCALQSSCNCLLFHFNMLLFKKKIKLLSDPKKKESQVIIHYLWFYFTEKRQTKIAQSFISAPSFILEIQWVHIKRFTSKLKAPLEFMDHLSRQSQEHWTFCQYFSAAASTVICYRPNTLATARQIRGLGVNILAIF